MNIIDDKLLTIINKKNFTTFIECFEYLNNAGYPESDAILISLTLFNGSPEDGIITINRANQINSIINRINIIAFSGTSTHMTSDGSDCDDLIIDVFFISKEGNLLYKPLYEAYIETRKYEKNEKLETHIKSIRIRLTTEIGIKFFLNIMEKQ